MYQHHLGDEQTLHLVSWLKLLESFGETLQCNLILPEKSGGSLNNIEGTALSLTICADRV